LKALVIGYGSIGERHVNNLLSYPNMEVIIHSRKDIDLWQKKRCKVFPTLKQCLDENPDIGLITNVTSLHVSTAIKLAKAGIDILIEKPLSDSMCNIDRLLKIVKQKKLITLMGCQLRFHKCIRKIKELISKKEVGKILSVHVESGSYLPNWHPNENYRTSYAARRDLGGGVVLTCIHEIDYLYWFFGDVKEVFSITGKYSNLDLSVDDLSSALLRFKNDIIVELHLDYFQRPDFRSCKIIGTKGTIYWDSETNTVKVYDIKKKKWIEKLKLLNFEKNTMYVDELSYFLNCVNKKKNTMNNVYQGTKTLQIALSIMKSGKTNRVVKL
jgi:predicted dehydrogenase